MQILTLALLLLDITTFYLWQRYKDKSQLYYFLICGIGTVMAGWEYSAKNILHLSGQTALVNKYAIITFWIVEFILFLLVTLKDRNKLKK